MATKKTNGSGGTQLSESFKNEVDSYEKSFKTIERFIDGVRAKPGMYIGPLGEAGLLNMFREIFQNAMDQILLERSPCNHVEVYYNELNNMVRVSDNGLGIPFEKIIDAYTKGHTGTHLEKGKEPGNYSAGTYGIGAKATNALSEYFDVKSFHYSGICKHVRFERGIPKVVEEIPNPEFRQGTEIEFVPDYTVLGETPLGEKAVRVLVSDILSLILPTTPATIHLVTVDHKNQVRDLYLTNERGIVGVVLDMQDEDTKLLIEPIYGTVDTGEMRLDVAFSFSTNPSGEEIVAYANLCPTSTTNKNTHVQGVLDGICGWFSNYMNKIYLTDREKQKIKVTSNDVMMSLRLMISAYHLEPQFTGQAKEVFSNADFRPFAKAVVSDILDTWSKARPGDLNKYSKFLKDVTAARIKSETEVIKATAKYNTDVITGLPDGYIKPTGSPKDGLELFIVEGKSALGSAKDARDPKTQGIYPIRGKILNAFQATNSAISANVELMSIAKILGGGYLRNFDLSKVKFKRIIFMTDADNDGAHIADLLLLDVLKLFPGMVEAGMVYKAVPPLYGVPVGKNKIKYFSTRPDYARYMQDQYYKSHEVLYATNRKKVEASVFASILMDNANYLYDMKTVSERMKLDPKLIEEVIVSYLKNEKIEALRKRLTAEYRFMKSENIKKINDSIKIKGLINGKVQTLFYDKNFIEECGSIIAPIKKALSENHMEFIVDGNVMGLYDTVFAAMNTSAVSRYKGLGEMNPDQLSESTMDANTRTLIRYTVNDINETMKVIRHYDSNKKEILKHICDVDRDDLIGI